MVSIIIPAYNAVKYIDDCLQSAINQTYSNVEIIVVDDGSTDDTGAVALKRAKQDSRIKVIRQNNQGLSASRNRGIEESSGQWIVFLDSDDMLPKAGVETLLNAVNEADADIACGMFTRDISMPDKPRKGGPLEILSGEDAIVDALYQKRLNSSANGKIYNSDLFKALKFRDGIYYEDLDLFYKLFERSKRIVYVPEVVYFYRETPESITRTFNDKRLNVLDVTRRIENWASGKSSGLKRAAADRRLSANFNMLGLLEAYGEAEKHTTECRECWEIIKKYRKTSFFNLRVRLKNKIGILLSLFGQRTLRTILKKHYKKTL